MSENIKIGIEASSNGTLPQVEREAGNASKQLAAAAQNSDKLNSSLKASKALQAAAAKQDPGMSNQEYGSARGTAGLTGASARDFANQSQGLGGLVRLYATYAANVFAVSAAFGALKSAMDTTNMVAGLDQLGAATGRNLGSLSKRLVTLTDGAISFRDSMDAVAKTTSAGMSSKDVERLAIVAKNASLALGVSMPDAINRLSRGISKLEPELLDELGIFTKIEPAVDAYARQIGKASSSLTDFERRQAFANAVLTEGESKFGELATAAVNPYDRLLATLKNVSQQALEVVNKVLGPIVSLLASSPTALAGALGVIGTMLVRQAIPALTEFKAGLAAAADTATQLSQRKAQDAKAARNQINSLILAEVENRAAKEIDAVDAAERKIEKLRQAGYAKNSHAAKLLAMDLDDIRKEDLQKQETIAKRLETKAANMAKDATADPKAVEAAKRNAEANRDVADSLTAAKKAQADYFTVERKVTEEREKAARGASVYGLTLQAAEAAKEAATKKSIISNAAYNASLIGVKGAFVLLQADIEKSGLVLSAWDLKILKSKAALAMFVGVMGTLGSAINKALGALAIISTVVGIFDGIFSNASKEMDAFSNALDKIDDAAANANRSLEYLNKKGGYAVVTIQGISSMANALNELSTSAEEAVVSSKAAISAMSKYESAKDWVKNLFGFGIDKNLANKLSKDIMSSLDILTASGVDKEVRNKFQQILNIDSLDAESVRIAILKLGDSAKTDLVKALLEANTALNNSSSRLQSFKSATEATTKAYQEFIQSTASNNPIFKLGTTLETLGKSMSDVFTGGVKEMEAAMIELAKSPEKGMLFGPEFTTKLVEIRQGFLDQTEAVVVYENRLKDLNKQIAQTQLDIKNQPQGMFSFIPLYRNESKLKELEGNKKTIEETIVTLDVEKIKQARDLFAKGVDNAFKEGGRLIEIGLGQAADKAAQTIAKARLGGLSGEARANEETRLAKQDIQIQMTAIQTNMNLILATERLRASIDESTAIQNVTIAKTEKKPQETIDKLQSAATVATAYKNLLGLTGTPNLNGDVAGQAGFAAGTTEAAQLQLKTLGVRNSLAGQEASLAEAKGSMAAADITGDRARRTGRLEDEQKILDLTTAVNQANINVRTTLSSISGVMSDQIVLAQSKIEQQIMEQRQLQERKAIEVAIQNAGGNVAQRDKILAEQKIVLQRQGVELDLQALQTRQKLLQIEIDMISKRYELTRSNSDLEKTIASSNLEVRFQELSIYGSLYNLSKDYLINQQAILDKEKTLLDTTTAMQAAEDAFGQKREEAEKRIDALRSSGAPSALEDEKKITEELARQEKLKNNTLAGLATQFKDRNRILEITRLTAIEQERINKVLEEINKRYEVQRSVAETQQTVASSNLELRSSELSIFGSLYDISKNYLINQQAIVDKEKLLLDTTSAMQSAQDSLSQKREEAELKIQSLRSANSTVPENQRVEAEQKIRDELTRQEQLTNNTLIGLNAQFTSRSQILELTKQANLEQEKYNQLIKSAESMSKNLVAVFGDMGTAIGNAVKAFADLAITSANNAEAQARLNKELEAAKKTGDDKKEKAAQTALDKQKREGLKAELDGISSVAGETKKMFKEKSAAYKMLSGVEKATAAVSMALKMQDFATTIATLPATISAGVAKLFEQGGWAGFLGAGAFLALMASLGSSSDAQASEPAFTGMNSEQRQETQGTGMTYDATGNKVETGGGVFGDSSAKVDNINKSLEVIRDNSVEGLSYDNQLLTTFKRVANALTGAAEAIYTIPGLRKGGAFGSQAGTVSSGGAFADIPIVGKLLGNIFGGGTSAVTTIQGAGIQLRGSFTQIIEDTSKSIQQYKDVLTQYHRSGGWFGKDSDWVVPERQTNAVKKEVAESIKDIFLESKSMFEKIGETAGVTKTQVENVFDTLKFGAEGDIDLQGLTGDQIVKELNAVIGSKLDEAAFILFSSFAEYKKFGEEYLTTVVRVVDTNTKIQQILTNMGIDKTVKGVFSVTEAMAKAAGGLDKFVEQYQFYKTNFLSDAEQLVPVQKAVSDELKRLEINTSITREGFVALVKSMDVTTTSGQETYQALMNLAPGIDQVFKAEEKIADQRAGLQKKILELENDTVTLRNKELLALDATNRALQKQIWALGEQQTAAKNLKSNLDGVTKTIKGQITSLTDYKNALLTGDKSTMTKSQQYQSAKDDINNLLSIINGIPKTKEEEDARNLAISKLSGSTDKFLGLSRELFASGAQYTADFNTVLATVAQTSSTLETQLTDSQRQLDALKTSEGYLFSIEASSKTTAELMQAYIDATTALIATGYSKAMATGTNYVPQDMTALIHKGERVIPAADNFVLMSRLTTTDNYTRDMAIQIRELNQKITSLERTVAEGAVMNAQATDRNTEQIAQAVTDGSDKTVQVTRIQNKATIK